MKKYPNLWFAIGFGLTLAVFAGLNYATYAIEVAREAALAKKGISFSNPGTSWGFPITMYMPYIGFDLTALAINIIAALVVAGLVGISTEALSDKLFSFRSR
jgi:hypothetical protein